MVSPLHPQRRFRRRDPIWFRPTHVALSRGARSALDLADVSPRVLLRRHSRGDWGILHDEPSSRHENEWALLHAATVRSLFRLPSGAEVLVETGGDRDLTTILLAGVDESYARYTTTPNHGSTPDRREAEKLFGHAAR